MQQGQAIVARNSWIRYPDAEAVVQYKSPYDLQHATVS